MAYLIRVLLSFTILFAVFTTFYSYQNLSSEISLPKVHTLTEVQIPLQNEGVSSLNPMREMSQDDSRFFKGKAVIIDVTDTNDDDDDDDDPDDDDDDDPDNDTNSDPDNDSDSGSNGGSGSSGSSNSNPGSGSNSGSNSGSGPNQNSGSGGSGSNGSSNSNSGPGPNSGPSENSGSGSDEETDTDSNTLDYTDLPILDPNDDSDTDTETEPTIYVIDLSDYSDGEDPIVVIEANQTRAEIPNLVGNEQPIVVYGDDASIASWWTLENQELGFESWADLEAYFESEFGRNPPTGIDINPGNLPFDIQIGILGGETGEVESVVELQGTEQQNLEVAPPDLILTTSVLDCIQVLTCQRILIAGIGSRNVCKNQLICPNSETGLPLENELPLDGEFGFEEELEVFQEILEFL